MKIWEAIRKKMEFKRPGVRIVHKREEKKPPGIYKVPSGGNGVYSSTEHIPPHVMRNREDERYWRSRYLNRKHRGIYIPVETPYVTSEQLPPEQINSIRSEQLPPGVGEEGRRKKVVKQILPLRNDIMQKCNAMEKLINKLTSKPLRVDVRIIE